MREADTLTNSAFPEPVNSVNSTKMAQVNLSDSDSPDEKRSHSSESMLTQQTQELAAAQEQLKYLLHELEASHQNGKRQQILIETLTGQLESSQQRIAQLERECFLVQQRYNEQCHQVVQTENTCRELHTRLTRQQRHTLQFKLALEKSLEVNVSSHQLQTERDFENAPYSGSLSLPKVQPIPPWPAQQEDLEQGSRGGALWPLGAGENDSSVQASPLVSEIGSESPLPLPNSSESDTGEAEEAHWQDLVSMLEAVEESVTANSAQEATVALPEALHSPAQLDEPLNQSEHVLQHVNWPSPLVYPLRPPKGRKSLAAIELPAFSRISDQHLAVAQFTPHSLPPDADS